MAVITVHLEQVNNTTTQGHVRTHSILIDRPVEKEGRDAGPMGGELFLLALGGCFNSNLLAAIRARNLPIDDIRIEIVGNLVQSPQRFDIVEMIVRSEYPDHEEFGKLVTIAERSCIVANSIRDGLTLRVRAEAS